ncbi:hypothetical protein ACNHKD_17680 [Methylocystis sp. JAN1]|uniref:hypothetical protein n=1 Tax=Methylocystis sp. JAN1 TaxID=3397211 RepID=UPI003FA20B90
MQRCNFTVSPLRRAGKALNLRGQELDSLAGSDALRGHFFSWRGATGRRYVCSVFQRGEEGFVSDVQNGVIIGVARDGAALRPACLFFAGERPASTLRRLAHELGVAEWHVHFCPDAEALRDLAGSLLN